MQRTPPDPARAIPEYLASLRINPNHEQALANLVRAYLLQKNLGEAQNTLNKLAQVNPDSPELPALRSMVQQSGRN
jgi:tetratricopeptide (TPR) repeat protein